MKKLITTLLVLIGFASLHSQTSNCQPLLITTGSATLCAEEPLSMNISFSLPAGCTYANAIDPFTLHKPTGTQNISAGSTSLSEPFAIEGDYYITTSLTGAGCPCMGTLTSNIIVVNPKPVSPNAGTDNFSCGDNILLNVTNTVTSDVGTYLWYDLSNSFLYAGNGYNPGPITNTTAYEVVNSLNGCVSDPVTVTATIDLLTEPSISSDTSITYPCNSSVTLNATSTEGTVQWYSSSNLDVNDLQAVGNQFTTVVDNSNVTYYASSVNGYCKSNPVEIKIKVLKPQAPILDDIVSCRYAELISVPTHNLNASLDGLFQWNYQGQIVHIGSVYEYPESIINQAGEYNFGIAEVLGSCVGDYDSIKVSIKGIPAIQTSKDYYSICENEDLTLDVSSFGNTLTFYWENPSNTNIETGSTYEISNINESLDEGIYNVYGLDSIGCKSELLPITVQVIPTPNIGLSSTYTIQDGETLNLFASDIDSVSWSPSEFLSNPNIVNPIFEDYPSLTSNETIEYTYYLDGYDLNNQCNAKDSTTIQVLPHSGDDKIKVYNLFTPNGDGDNDVWFIDFIYNLTQYEIYVYDKNNKIVYYHNSENGSYDNNRWNGTLMNSDERVLSTGAYRYTIVAPNEYPTNPKKGVITLLH